MELAKGDIFLNARNYVNIVIRVGDDAVEGFNLHQHYQWTVLKGRIDCVCKIGTCKELVDSKE